MEDLVEDASDASDTTAAAPSDGTKSSRSIFVNDGQTTFVRDGAAAASADRTNRKCSASRKRSQDGTKQKAGPKRVRLESNEGHSSRAKRPARITMNVGRVGNFIEHVNGGTVTMDRGGIRYTSDKQTNSSSSRKTPGAPKVRVINGPPSPSLKKRLAINGIHVNYIGTYVEEISGPGNLSFDWNRQNRQFTSGAGNEDTTDDSSDDSPDDSPDE